MRIHIELDDHVVEELDRRVGLRGRSAFVAQLLAHALGEEQRWDDIKAAMGAVSGIPHEWDEDTSGWIRAQRRSDPRRSG